MGEKPDLAALVPAAQQGDAQAWEAIAAAFRDRIARYIVTMIGDPDVARVASAQLDGDRLTISNVRNFAYRSKSGRIKL